MMRKNFFLSKFPFIYSCSDILLFFERDLINSSFNNPDLILSGFTPLTLIPTFPNSRASCLTRKRVAFGKP